MLEETSDLGSGFGLPRFVIRTFDAYLRCGILAHGFARVRCEDCAAEHLVGFSCKRRGVCSSCEGRKMADTAARLIDCVLPAVPYEPWTLSYPRQVRFLLARNPRLVAPALAIFVSAVSTEQRRIARKLGLRDPKTGSVTSIQRFGSTINLHLHYHSVFAKGVFVAGEKGVAFHELPEPSAEDLERIAHRIAKRTLALLRREIPAELDDQGDSDALSSIHVESAQASLPFTSASPPETPKGHGRGISAFVNGFSLHKGRVIHSNDRDRLERVLRYGARPPIAQDRLSYDGHTVRYRLRKPTPRGQTELRLEPATFLRRLASLIPPPRQNTTRYHGVFAPRSRLRALIAPARQADDDSASSFTSAKGRPPSPRYRRRWAELLKRVFEQDVTRCSECGGPVRLIAVIENRAVIEKILGHLGLATTPPARAPPRTADDLLDFGADGEQGALFEPA